MLAVVQDQEHFPPVQRIGQTRHNRAGVIVPDAERAGDLRQHERRLAERRERDKGGSVRISTAHAVADLQREPRLAHAARPGERQQPDLRPMEEREDRLHHRRPPDERCRREGQSCRGAECAIVWVLGVFRELRAWRASHERPAPRP